MRFLFAARPRAAAVVVVLALGLPACESAPEDDTAQYGVVAVTTQPARVTTLRETTNVSGTVTPIAAADFLAAASTTCTVGTILKNEGDTVAAGDIVVRLDMPAVMNDIATRQLEVNDAKARLDAAKAESERLGGLFDKGLAARNLWDAARSAESAAQQAYSASLTRFDTAKAQEASTIIRARFPGVVWKVFHQPGDVVAGQNDPILRIVDPAQLQVVARVPLTDSARIMGGQVATVRTIAGDEPAVVSIKLTPMSTEAETVEVRFNFLAPTQLPIDTVVPVDVVLDERPGAVVVPAEAVQREGADTFVWVPNDNSQAIRRPVRTGLYVGTLAQIVDGLKAGETVIVTGIAQLTDGAPITISSGGN
jgi:RND family efflux transporter MFP subunit